MNCAYCAKGELAAKFGYEVCELPASVVYLFKEQSHPGRCIVASNHHVSEMLELSEEELLSDAELLDEELLLEDEDVCVTLHLLRVLSPSASNFLSSSMS